MVTTVKLAFAIMMMIDVGVPFPGKPMSTTTRVYETTPGFENSVDCQKAAQVFNHLRGRQYMGYRPAAPGKKPKLIKGKIFAAWCTVAQKPIYKEVNNVK